MFNFKDKKAAEKWYKKNKEALNRVAQHKDFHIIMGYWDIEYDRIDSRIDSLKGRELEEAVIERSLIKKHINWINNLTN